jgi:hypothetical protein
VTGLRALAAEFLHEAGYAAPPPAPHGLWGRLREKVSHIYHACG